MRSAAAGPLKRALEVQESLRVLSAYGVRGPKKVGVRELLILFGAVWMFVFFLGFLMVLGWFFVAFNGF